MEPLEDFDKQVKAALSKGKALSASTVSAISKLALTNMETNDAHLVATLFRQHKKASSATKIYSLYLIDAIAREARSLTKKAGKSKDDSLKDAGYSTFLTKLEAVLSKLVVDCWENGKVEHREKVRKVLDIWSKASTFGSSSLKRIDQKLSDSEQGKASDEGASASAASSISVSASAQAASASTNLSSLPPSVAALLATNKAPDPPALSVKDEVERAIAAARAGVSSVAPVPQPPPPSSLQSASSSGPSVLPAFDPSMFDASKLAALQQTLNSVNLPPPAPSASVGQNRNEHGGGWSGQGSQQRGGWEGHQPGQQGDWSSSGQGYGQSRQQLYGAGSGGGGAPDGEGERASGAPGSRAGRRVAFDTSRNQQYDDPRSQDAGQSFNTRDRPSYPTRRRSPSPPASWSNYVPESVDDQPPRKKRWDAPAASASLSTSALPVETRPAPPERPPVPSRSGGPADTSMPSTMPPRPQEAQLQSHQPAQSMDMSKFDPTSPASWAAFAPTLQAMNGGQMPSMQMVMQWCFMMQMQAQAMQQQMQGGGLGGVPGEMGMTGQGFASASAGVNERYGDEEDTENLFRQK